MDIGVGPTVQHFKKPDWNLADWGALLTGITAIYWLLLYLLPITVWFHVYSITVLDAVEGDTIEMYVDRAIHRDFDGSYNVDVRNVATGERFCKGEDSLRYKVENKLPDPITLSWWAYDGHGGEGCPDTLPAGQYVMETCHNVHLGGVVGTKTDCRKNVFTVYDKDGGAAFPAQTTGRN